MKTSGRRKRRFIGRALKKEEMTLQITSMADIFTIILVFLLKTFSTGITNISPQNIVLPDAHGSDEVVEVLKLEIAPNAILLDDKPITALDGFQLRPADLESNGTPRSLNAALIEHKEKEAIVEEENAAQTDSEKKKPRLLVLADRKTPFATLKVVLTAAANTGFGEFKLAVVEDR